MYQPLAPCPRCRRHVRVEPCGVEPHACPFCSASLQGLAGPANLPAARLSRAAIFVAATLGLAACNQESVPATQDPATKVKPKTTADPSTSKPADNGGAKPVDDGGPDDPGAQMAEYGAPAPPPPKPKPPVAGADGGPDDLGTSHPKYGGPGLMPPPMPAYGGPPKKMPPKGP